MIKRQSGLEKQKVALTLQHKYMNNFMIQIFLMKRNKGISDVRTNCNRITEDLLHINVTGNKMHNEFLMICR
jgi:hypothetical protein